MLAIYLLLRVNIFIEHSNFSGWLHLQHQRQENVIIVNLMKQISEKEKKTQPWILCTHIVVVFKRIVMYSIVQLNEEKNNDTHTLATHTGTRNSKAQINVDRESQKQYATHKIICLHTILCVSLSDFSYIFSLSICYEFESCNCRGWRYKYTY